MISIKSQKIIFLNFAKYPSTAAESVNIIKMCESTVKLGYDVLLMADIRVSREEIYKHYNIKSAIHMEGIKVHNIRFLGRIIFLLRAWFRLRGEKDVLIWVRDIFNGYLIRILKIPFIYELHEVSPNRFRKYLLRKILLSRHLRRLVFISKQLKIKLEENEGALYKNTDHVIAHDGVDLDDFKIPGSRSEIRKRLHLPDQKYLAGYTGSLFKGRGAYLALEIARRLHHINFVFVGGEGEFLSDFRRNIEIMGLNNVHTVGYIPHCQIPSYLSAFDILLMPYQQTVLHRQKKHDTASYMSPLKMFEYMASGKPIIASDLLVLREVLKDKKNALLIKPDDLEEWIRAIESVRNDPVLASDLGNKAREDIKEFSWLKRVQKILDFNFLESQ